jgi:hypothetical protein
LENKLAVLERNLQSLNNQQSQKRLKTNIQPRGFSGPGINRVATSKFNNTSYSINVPQSIKKNIIENLMKDVQDIKKSLFVRI